MYAFINKVKCTTKLLMWVLVVLESVVLLWVAPGEIQQFFQHLVTLCMWDDLPSPWAEGGSWTGFEY